MRRLAENGGGAGLANGGLASLTNWAWLSPGSSAPLNRNTLHVAVRFRPRSSARSGQSSVTRSPPEAGKAKRPARGARGTFHIQRAAHARTLPIEGWLSHALLIDARIRERKSRVHGPTRDRRIRLEPANSTFS